MYTIAQARTPDETLRLIAIVWGGANRDDWMAWELHDREGTKGKGLGYLCPAFWVARWGKDSLNALIAAGYTYRALCEVYASETLPAPDAIATLVALRSTARPVIS